MKTVNSVLASYQLRSRNANSKLVSARKITPKVLEAYKEMNFRINILEAFQEVIESKRYSLKEKKSMIKALIVTIASDSKTIPYQKETIELLRENDNFIKIFGKIVETDDLAEFELDHLTNNLLVYWLKTREKIIRLKQAGKE